MTTTTCATASSALPLDDHLITIRLSPELLGSEFSLRLCLLQKKPPPSVEAEGDIVVLNATSVAGKRHCMAAAMNVISYSKSGRRSKVTMHATLTIIILEIQKAY